MTESGYVWSQDTSSDLTARLDELEKQSAALRRELATLKSQKTAQVVPMAEANYITLDELSAEINKELKQNSWRQGEFRIVPYGMVWASLLAASSQTSPEDAVMWIMPEDTHGQDTCTLTARRSRLGIWMDGPDMCFFGGVHTSGKVEIDFMGGINPTHNKPGILLREVYWKMENTCFQFLVGQTKDIISPLSPHSLNYTLLWNAGNIGYRHPQFRLERYYYWGERTKMEVQMSLSHISGSDLPDIDFSPGFPTVQARLGWEIQQCENPYPIRFGISGHYGKQGYTLNTGGYEINSWSVNADVHIPVTSRVGFQGEFFHGQGLAGFLGGVEQSLDYRPSAANLGTRNSIHSTGGWGEIWWDITDRLHGAVGYGIDKPREADMTACTRLANSAIYVNLVYDFSKYLRSGIEYSYWKTEYRGGDTANASVIEWTWQLNF